MHSKVIDKWIVKQLVEYFMNSRRCVSQTSEVLKLVFLVIHLHVLARLPVWVVDSTGESHLKSDGQCWKSFQAHCNTGNQNAFPLSWGSCLFSGPTHKQEVSLLPRTDISRFTVVFKCGFAMPIRTGSLVQCFIFICWNCSWHTPSWRQSWNEKSKLWFCAKARHYLVISAFICLVTQAK